RPPWCSHDSAPCLRPLTGVHSEAATWMPSGRVLRPQARARRGRCATLRATRALPALQPEALHPALHLLPRLAHLARDAADVVLVRLQAAYQLVAELSVRAEERDLR